VVSPGRQELARGAFPSNFRASGLALVTAAIVLWNTIYLGRALDTVRRRGDPMPDVLLAHLAPLGWQHINLTGDYLWAAKRSYGRRRDLIRARCAAPFGRASLSLRGLPLQPYSQSAAIFAHAF
jgi:hypothetical protein